MSGGTRRRRRTGAGARRTSMGTSAIVTTRRAGSVVFVKSHANRKSDTAGGRFSGLSPSSAFLTTHVSDDRPNINRAGNSTGVNETEYPREGRNIHAKVRGNRKPAVALEHLLYYFIVGSPPSQRVSQQ